MSDIYDTQDKPDIELLFDLWRAAQDYSEALLERNQLIRECLARDISPTRIAESAGITKQSVYRYKKD